MPPQVGLGREGHGVKPSIANSKFARLCIRLSLLFVVLLVLRRIVFAKASVVTTRPVVSLRIGDVRVTDIAVGKSLNRLDIALVAA